MVWLRGLAIRSSLGDLSVLMSAKELEISWSTMAIDSDEEGAAGSATGSGGLGAMAGTEGAAGTTAAACGGS